MVNLWKCGRVGHFISCQRSLRCVLPKLFARFGMLAYLTVPTVSSCEILGGNGSEASCGVEEESFVRTRVDSSNFTINVKTDCRISDEASSCGILNMDVFVYGGEMADELELYLKEDGATGEMHFRSSKETKRVAIIANSPFKFRYDALSSFDSMENMEFRFEDDDQVNPIMTGVCTLEPAREGTVTLRPLMSRIVLDAVSNNMRNYVRLENPRVFLTDAAAVCEAFREDGFYPSESMEESSRQPLPCDVGLFTQKPGTELFCYPSEGNVPEATCMVLECEIKGNTCRFSAPLSPLGRNVTKHVEFSVDTIGISDSKVYQSYINLR